MNATIHAQLSVRRRGGSVEDWYPLHDMMDWSKEAESSNAHRAFSHSMWFVKEVMVPVWGHTLQLSDGGTANVKDALEQDHLLADNGDRFIATLEDYLSLVADDPSDKALIAEFDFENAAFYAAHPQVRELMLSPLGLTGKVTSLLITHNSWFVQRILPRVFPGVQIEIRDFAIAPSRFFNRMTYADWLNNGRGTPPSFAKINEHRRRKAGSAAAKQPISDAAAGNAIKHPIEQVITFDKLPPSGRDVVYDGGRGPRGIPSEVVDGGRRILPFRDGHGPGEPEVIKLWGLEDQAPPPEDPLSEGHEYVRDVDGVARGVRPIRKPDHLLD